VSHKHLTIPSDTEQLKAVRDAVFEMAEPCLPGKAHMVVLAVDEAVSNVMRHGGHSVLTSSPLQPSEFQLNSGAIDVDIDSNGIRLQVLIADGGPKYNPCSTPAQDAAERTLARSRGGMGLSIMRRVMDEIHYDRTPDERNELRMIKYINPVS